MRNKARMLKMGEIPRVRILPPLRCGEHVGSTPIDVCGKSARYQRSTVSGLVSSFACDEHRRPDDKPLPIEFTLRHVTVTCDAVFAGASFVPNVAELEALEQLRRGVESVGGLLNLHDVRSHIGLYTAAVPAGSPNAKRGGA